MSNNSVRRAEIVSVIALAVALLGNITVYTVGYVARSNLCDATTRSSNFIADRIEESDRVLGTRSGPGYDYYQEHPDELIQAHKNNAESIKAFRNKDC